MSGRFHMEHPENELVRSQDLPMRWHDAGQFYVGPPESWLEHKNLLTGVRALELPVWRVQDIDTAQDWVRAEVMAEVSSRIDG